MIQNNLVTYIIFGSAYGKWVHGLAHFNGKVNSFLLNKIYIYVG